MLNKLLTSKNSAKLKQYYYFHAEFLEEVRYIHEVIIYSMHGAALIKASKLSINSTCMPLGLSLICQHNFGNNRPWKHFSIILWNNGQYFRIIKWLFSSCNCSGWLFLWMYSDMFKYPCNEHTVVYKKLIFFTWFQTLWYVIYTTWWS